MRPPNKLSDWTLEKVRSKCVPDPITDCWIWQGTKISTGYGIVNINWKRILVHRIVAGLGEKLPPKSEVCHRCHTPSCVNPAHLYVGDSASNSRDMIDAGRSAKGSTHSQHKLVDAEVVEIRERFARGDPQAFLAHQFGVSQSAISLIVSQKRWRHL